MGDVYTATGIVELTAWLARLGYSDGATRLHGALTRWRESERRIERPEIAG